MPAQNLRVCAWWRVWRCTPTLQEPKPTHSLSAAEKVILYQGLHSVTRTGSLTLTHTHSLNRPFRPLPLVTTAASSGQASGPICVQIFKCFQSALTIKSARVSLRPRCGFKFSPLSSRFGHRRVSEREQARWAKATVREIFWVASSSSFLKTVFFLLLLSSGF